MRAQSVLIIFKYVYATSVYFTSYVLPYKRKQHFLINCFKSQTANEYLDMLKIENISAYNHAYQRCARQS